MYNNLRLYFNTFSFMNTICKKITCPEFSFRYKLQHPRCFSFRYKPRVSFMIGWDALMSSWKPLMNHDWQWKKDKERFKPACEALCDVPPQLLLQISIKRCSPRFSKAHARISHTIKIIIPTPNLTTKLITKIKWNLVQQQPVLNPGNLRHQPPCSKSQHTVLTGLY